MELIFILGFFILAALICLLIKHRGVIELASVVATIVALGESIVVAVKVANSGIYQPFAIFSVDALGAIVMLIIATIGLAASFYSVFYLREETIKNIIGFHRVKQYFILLNLFLLAMFFAVIVSSPILMWVAIEATTLSTAFLVSFYNKPSAMEAAWKYLIINSVGLLLAFFGTLLYYTATKSWGVENLVSWNILSSSVGLLDPMIAKVAFIFILIGYGTKVGLAPMQTWLPDAHSKAPVPVSALLSGVLLNVALVAVLRFKFITDVVVGQGFTQQLMILFGVLSIVVASLFIFTQKNYKRLLAYSSIENMGIATLGFGLGGLGAFAAILHLIYHALIKSALFLSVGNIFLKFSSTKIANVRGALVALPFTAILFFTGFLAITGTPPFGLFLTKVYILSTAMQSHPATTIITFLAIVIIFIGFLRHLMAMIFGAKPADIKTGETNRWLLISPLVLITIVIFLSFHIPLFLEILINAVTAKF